MSDSSVGMSSPTSANPELNVNDSFKYHDQLYSGDESKYKKHRFNRRDSLVSQVQKKISLKTIGAIFFTFLTFTSIHAHRTKSTLIVDNAGLREKLSIQQETNRNLEREVSNYKSDIRKLKSDIRTVTNMEDRLQELRSERDTLVVQRDDMKLKLEQALMQPKGHVSNEHVQEDQMAHAEVGQIIESTTNTLSEAHHAPEIEKDPKHHPYWAYLSDYSRMAATVLGYDQKKWDESEVLPIFQKALHELTHEERSATTVLWLESYFKETDPKDLPGKGVAEEIVRDPNMHPGWSGLSDFSRIAATLLGYDRDKWNSDDAEASMPIFKRRLDQLSDEEREAVRFLFLERYFH